MLVARNILAALAFLKLTSCAVPVVPKGYNVPEITHSPNHHYGVAVPDIFEENPALASNSLVDLRTGRILGELKGLRVGFSRQNHGGVVPTRWSRDGTLLLWFVYGKWCPHSLVLAKIKEGAISWQTDIQDIAQKEILRRTRQAAPKQYETSKMQNVGNGSVYPEGFTVDVHTEHENSRWVSVPLKVFVDLTSDPKFGTYYPEPPSPSRPLESWLIGVVDSEGHFRVTHFELGRRPKSGTDPTASF